LSVTFIVLWLLGDLTNLFGAVMAKLLPTMIILAVYVSFVVWFCASKVTSETSSCRGKRTKRGRKKRKEKWRAEEGEEDEEEVEDE
jgi:choline-glycine betaine transporter